MSDRFDLEGAFTTEQVPDVRRFTERLLAWIPDRDMRARVSLATHELFENAIKFSGDGQATLLIEITREPLQVRITTKNRAGQANLASLHKLSTRLQEAADAMSFYLGMMKDAPAARGGLGIGRVAAEAEMNVSMHFEQDVVIVRAELAT